MDVTAHLRHLHMSPRKVRRVAHLMRGLSVVRADAELTVRKELAAVPLQKLLRSAIANAKTMTDAKPEEMRIVSCVVNEGRAVRRFRPRSRGTAHPVLRRSSHISLVLDVPQKTKRARPAAPSATTDGGRAPVPSVGKKDTPKVSPSDSDGIDKRESASERPMLQRKSSEERTKRRMPRLPSARRRFFQRKSV